VKKLGKEEHKQKTIISIQHVEHVVKYLYPFSNKVQREGGGVATPLEGTLTQPYNVEEAWQPAEHLRRSVRRASLQRHLLVQQVLQIDPFYDAQL